MLVGAVGGDVVGLRFDEERSEIILTVRAAKKRGHGTKGQGRSLWLVAVDIRDGVGSKSNDSASYEKVRARHPGARPEWLLITLSYRVGVDITKPYSPGQLLPIHPFLG